MGNASPREVFSMILIYIIDDWLTTIRIRTANILIVGIKALGAEVAKNLVLAGIGSLTIVDDSLVTEEDLGASFLLTESDISKPIVNASLPSLQKLNPRVYLTPLSSPPLTLPPDFYNPFTICITTTYPLPILTHINASCRLANTPFYCAQAHGLYGYIFADLIQHTYVITRSQSNIPTKLVAESPTRSIIATATKFENGKNIEYVTKREIYTPLILANSSPLPSYYSTSPRRKRAVSPLLPCLRALFEYQALTNSPTPTSSREDLALFTTLATQKHAELLLPAETLTAEFLRKFLQNVGVELAPVTAFLGGQLAQDVINVVGGREQPIQNFVCFDGETSVGTVFALCPMVTELEGGDGGGGRVSVVVWFKEGFCLCGTE
jgi:ubiquitin-like 1-activating enzyme E1 A